jgi:hypothetical protein
MQRGLGCTALHPPCCLVLVTLFLCFGLATSVCPAGSYASGNSCVYCGSGTYSSAVDSSACTACAANTYRTCTSEVVHYACNSGCAVDIGNYNLSPWNNVGFKDIAARWIWNTADAATGSPAVGTVNFYKKIFIGPCHKCFTSGSTVSATFYVLVDNSAAVTVNGILAVSSASKWDGTGYSFTANMNVGINTVSVAAYNGGGPAGLALSVYCGTDTVIDHSDSTWCVGASCTATLPMVSGVYVTTTVDSLIGIVCNTCNPYNFFQSGVSLSGQLTCTSMWPSSYSKYSMNLSDYVMRQDNGMCLTDFPSNGGKGIRTTMNSGGVFVFLMYPSFKFTKYFTVPYYPGSRHEQISFLNGSSFLYNPPVVGRGTSFITFEYSAKMQNWGTTFRFGYDQNQDGRVDGFSTTEAGPGWWGQWSQNTKIISADGTYSAEYYLAMDSVSWYRFRCAIDLINNKITMYMKIDSGVPSVWSVLGTLYDISAALDWTVDNARNPLKWNGFVWGVEGDSILAEGFEVYTFNPGTYINPSFMPDLCPTGSYCPSMKSIIACAAGQTSPAGSSSATACCAPGSMYSSSLGACEVYAIRCTSKSECINYACIGSSYQPDDWTSGNTAIMCDGTYCKHSGPFVGSGYQYCNNNAPCLRGTYSQSSSSTACTLASAGYYVSSSGASAQTPCAVGTYSSPNASSCTFVCSAGTYKALLSQCLPATPGNYSDSGVLTPCLQGTFSSMSGLTVCTSCMPGTFNNGLKGSSSAVCSLCSAGGYGSSDGASVCTACTTGKYNTAAGVTACAVCPVGKFANVEGLAYDCTWCTAGVNYNTNTGSSACTVCSASCDLGKQIQGPCTPTTNTFCGACTPVANCMFLPGTPCGNNSNPNCMCLPGFELIGNQCQQCKQGFFKSTNSTLPCSEWTLSPACSNGYFRSNGTRFINTACLPCPSPPENATLKGTACEWGCSVGFNNTI